MAERESAPYRPEQIALFEVTRRFATIAAVNEGADITSAEARKASTVLFTPEQKQNAAQMNRECIVTPADKVREAAQDMKLVEESYGLIKLRAIGSLNRQGESQQPQQPPTGK
jgi:hypothetical protein